MLFTRLSYLTAGLLFSLLTFTACSDDDPITSGSSVTVTNTFQSTAFTMDAELAIEDLFMAPAGSLAATATVGDGLEFDNYLLNLYDINIDESSITFTCVAAEDDPNYGTLFRILEPATFDRYYFTFAEDQNVSSGTVSNSSVDLRIDSDKVLVVEIGAGYDFKPGQSFTVSLK